MESEEHLVIFKAKDGVIILTPRPYIVLRKEDINTLANDIEGDNDPRTEEIKVRESLINHYKKVGYALQEQIADRDQLIKSLAAWNADLVNITEGFKAENARLKKDNNEQAARIQELIELNNKYYFKLISTNNFNE